MKGMMNQCFGGGLDPHVQLLLTQAAIDGYTAASGSVLSALNNFVIGLKVNNLWDLLDLLHVPATNGDSAFAGYNVKDATAHYMTAYNNITFITKEGFVGNNIDSYLSSEISLSTDPVNYSLSKASVGVYLKDNPQLSTSNQDLFIALGTYLTRLILNSTGAKWTRVNTSSNVYGNTARSGTGLFSLIRRSSLYVTLYKGSSSLGGISSGSNNGLPLGTNITWMRNGYPGKMSLMYVSKDIQNELPTLNTLIEDYMTAIAA